MNVELDFNLHDFVRLRLVDATRHDVNVVQRQVGLQPESPSGEADVMIRFVDEFADHKKMNILGNWEYGYTNDAFWVLRGSQGQDVALQLPLQQVGERCELVCRRPFAAVPLLGSILNLTALAKGLLPLHASAFLYEGESTLVTGWSKGGKTESLLAFAEQGATYVGDEWIYIDADSQTMYGMPQRIHLWDWHLDSPAHRARLTTAQRLKLASLRLLTSLLQPFAKWQGSAAKFMRSLADSAQQRRHVRVSPDKLFRGRIQTAAACPQRLFFMASHASSCTEVRPISMEEIISRMAVSLEHEFDSLTTCYRHYRFAFPGRTNRLLEQLPELLHARLAAAFQNKEGLAVWHPYPVPTRDLFDAMRPFVGQSERNDTLDSNPMRNRGRSTPDPVALACVESTSFLVPPPPSQSPDRSPFSDTSSQLACGRGLG